MTNTKYRVSTIENKLSSKKGLVWYYVQAKFSWLPFWVTVLHPSMVSYFSEDDANNFMKEVKVGINWIGYSIFKPSQSMVSAYF